MSLAAPSLDRVMARKQTQPEQSPTPKPTMVRISGETLRWLRIASGFTGESVAAYLDRVALERAKADAKAEAKKMGD